MTYHVFFCFVFFVTLAVTYHMVRACVDCDQATRYSEWQEWEKHDTQTSARASARAKILVDRACDFYL